ncbi:MAG: sigma-70 family RNA polymerase sigma factor [Candidatus Omnitrophica bacterium]|nr:sigma-70 family RNA polymerase sigma factor [Candidatus Omnitrophota bacterium]
MNEDLELIERLKGGERAAFKQLVDKYKKKSYAIAYSILEDKEESKDVLQEAFVKVFYSINSFRQDASFSTWFYRILVNLCKDHLRKRSKQFISIDATFKTEEGSDIKKVEIADLRENPISALVNKEAGAMINKALNKLPTKQRLAFILKHIDGLGIEEISNSLGCSISTCKVHLFRAVRSLRRQLIPYYKEA